MKRKIALLGIFAVCAVLPTVVVAAAPTQTCLTGTDPSVANDATQIRAVRALIDAACPCASYDGSTGNGHSAYVKCAQQVVAAQIATPPGNLRKQCKRTVMTLTARSTCGKNPSLHPAACIKTSLRNGNHKCAILPTTKKDGVTANDHCVDTAKLSAVECAAYTHCIDAADTDADLRITTADTGACVPTPTPTVPPPDPVNGDWSPWGTCFPDPMLGCIQMRTCDNPPPQFGGAACPGSNVQSCDPSECAP